MTERIWSRVWTQRHVGMRVSGSMQYVQAVSPAEAVRELRGEFPHVLVTSRTTQHRHGGRVSDAERRGRDEQAS